MPKITKRKIAASRPRYAKRSKWSAANSRRKLTTGNRSGTQLPRILSPLVPNKATASTQNVVKRAMWVATRDLSAEYITNWAKGGGFQEADATSMFNGYSQFEHGSFTGMQIYAPQLLDFYDTMKQIRFAYPTVQRIKFGKMQVIATLDRDIGVDQVRAFYRTERRLDAHTIGASGAPARTVERKYWWSVQDKKITSFAGTKSQIRSQSIRLFDHVPKLEYFDEETAPDKRSAPRIGAWLDFDWARENLVYHRLMMGEIGFDSPSITIDGILNYLSLTPTLNIEVEYTIPNASIRDTGLSVILPAQAPGYGKPAYVNNAPARLPSPNPEDPEPTQLVAEATLSVPSVCTSCNCVK